MKYLVVLLFLGFFVATGSGIKCYQCVHYEDHDDETTAACKDLSGLEPMNCSSSEDDDSWHCVKRDGKTVEDELKYVERGCSKTRNSIANTCKESNALDTPYGIAEKGSLCFCDDADGCNGALFLPTTSSTLQILSFTVFAFAFYLF